MQRIRGLPRIHEPDVGSFWAHLKCARVHTSEPAEIEENQRLKETMPPQFLEDERYDPASLGGHLLPRFRSCQDKWGMKDLPDNGDGPVET